MTQPASPFVSLDGTLVYGLRLVLPNEGLWHADVWVVTPETSTSPTLLLAGTTWRGAVIRSITFSGETRLRMVAGAGGWRRSLSALQYSSQAGVPTQTVIRDAATAVGEPSPIIDPSVPASLGTGYVRRTGPASTVLQDLQSRGVLPTWWADSMGTVQTGFRPNTTVQQPFVAEQVHGDVGWYRISTETPGEWLPGASFSGPTVSGTVNRVEHVVRGGKFWSEVMVA